MLYINIIDKNYIRDILMVVGSIYTNFFSKNNRFFSLFFEHYLNISLFKSFFLNFKYIYRLHLTKQIN